MDHPFIVPEDHRDHPVAGKVWVTLLAASVCRLLKSLRVCGTRD